MARSTLAGLLVCLLALAGCSQLADLGELREDLDAAGYEAGRIQHQTNNGVSYLSIAVTTESDPAPEDAERIAEVAWTTYPGEFERLRVWINETVQLDETDDELATRFGERPADLTATEEDGNPVGLILTAVSVAILLAALMVVVWLRGRRSGPPPPPRNPHPGGYFQYPPQPPQG